MDRLLASFASLLGPIKAAKCIWPPSAAARERAFITSDPLDLLAAWASSSGDIAPLASLLAAFAREQHAMHGTNVTSTIVMSLLLASETQRALARLCVGRIVLADSLAAVLDRFTQLARSIAVTDLSERHLRGLAHGATSAHEYRLACALLGDDFAPGDSLCVREQQVPLCRAATVFADALLMPWDCALHVPSAGDSLVAAGDALGCGRVCIVTAEALVCASASEVACSALVDECLCCTCQCNRAASLLASLGVRLLVSVGPLLCGHLASACIARCLVLVAGVARAAVDDLQVFASASESIESLWPVHRACDAARLADGVSQALVTLDIVTTTPGRQGLLRLRRSGSCGAVGARDTTPTTTHFAAVLVPQSPALAARMAQRRVRRTAATLVSARGKHSCVVAGAGCFERTCISEADDLARVALLESDEICRTACDVWTRVLERFVALLDCDEGAALDENNLSAADVFDDANAKLAAWRRALTASQVVLASVGVLRFTRKRD